MSDLISRSKVISVLEQLEEHSLTGKMYISNAIYLLNNQPTAYSVYRVVGELESFAKLAEDRWTNGTSEHAYQEHKCWIKAIEIVKQGGVSDDVYKPSADKIKVTSLEVIVTGSKRKPYFEIKYKEVGTENYNIG